MPTSALPLHERTLTGVWTRAVAAVPDKVFVRWADNSLSYAAFDALSNRVANGLASLGVGKGDKVALMLGNSVEFLAGWFGTVKLGAVYVPINTDYKGDILRHQLDRADVTHILIEADYLARLTAVTGALPQLRAAIVVRGPSQVETPASFAIYGYEDLLAASDRSRNVEVHYTDPLAISFTSGTTGPSKGVLASHCHVMSFALDWIEACGFREDDRLYSCLPMFHAIATWLGVIPTVIRQTTTAFADRFSASRFWDDVRTFDATVVHGIFAMVPILLKQPPRTDDATVPARLFYIGQRNAEFEQRFGCRIVEVYGATETGIVTYTPLDVLGPPGSCGRPNARTYDLALLDDDDNVLPAGTAGEICVRPRQPHSMFQGYYGMADETVAAWRNLWFHTGDNARADADGWLYFVDRKKDAIRRRGENISSYELEAVVNGDPRVLECAAVAHPAELGEDDVRMVIVAQPGAGLSAADIWTLCEDRMPRFWIPRYVEFRDALPKTPNGKVQKYLLRAGAEGGVIHDRERTMETAP